MFKKKIIIILISLILLILILMFLAIGLGKSKKVKNLIGEENVYFIKTKFFPYKYINDLKSYNEDLKRQIYNLNNEKKILNSKVGKLIQFNNNANSIKNYELNEKNSLNDLIFSKLEKISLKSELNEFILLKLKNNQLTYGINDFYPGSGYIDIYKNKIWLLSARGILGYGNLGENEITFLQIKNNLDDFLGIDQISEDNWFSFKDLKIFNKKIFISFTDEISENCWNTSIIFGELNYELIDFEYFFKPKECVHSKNNLDQEFNAHQSGGRIINVGNEKILFSIGDYRSRHLAQNKDSVNGKIITINVNNKTFELLSMGHRNPQGLYFDKEEQIILETEHGPSGGDEINIINFANNLSIPNYGWPIASYGEHYGNKEANKNKYKKYPLYKSHKEHGFIEPIMYDHLGISEITRIKDRTYVVSSLGSKILIFFKLKKNNSIEILDKVKVYERIRDIKFHNDKLYLFLEDTASIGIINLKTFNF